VFGSGYPLCGNAELLVELPVINLGAEWSTPLARPLSRSSGFVLLTWRIVVSSLIYMIVQLGSRKDQAEGPSPADREPGISTRQLA
jgi:hypothetical protein